MSFNSSRIRGICFDVDGTLTDTDDLFVRRLNNLLKPLRLILPNRDSLSLARRIIMATENPATYLHGLLDRFGIDGVAARLGGYFYRIGLGRSVTPFTLIPGVVEMLDKLSSHYSLAVVSARGEASVEIFLKQFNLSKYFRVVVTAQTCKRTKPHPSPILWAAKHMDLPPEECLMVGDTTVDIIAGKLSGSQTAGVLCGFGGEKELRNAGADLILTTTPELVKYMH